MTRVFRFGVFELDPGTGELRRSGVRIHVQDQPVRILEMLLERQGELVTREEIRARIWGDTFVDYDRALNTAIRKLRDALNDSAEAPRYIETIPKRGYRFIAPVVVDEGTVDRQEDEERDAPTRSISSVVVSIVIAMAITIVAILYLRGPKPTYESLAVLPFANLTGAAANEYIADGFTDSLISDLAHIPELRVISRTSAMHYKNARKPLPEIAKELNVGALVEGSLMRFGDRARVEVKLIDASKDSLLWSQEYERGAGELEALQRDVAAAVASQLRSRIAASKHVPESEAHLLTLRGRHWLNEKRDGNVARQLFREAVAKDPTYAAPWAGIAQAEIFAPEARVSPRDALLLARDAAEKALALDPNSAEAHSSLAMVRMFLDRDFVASEREFKRALELQPGSGEIHHRYAQLLAAAGRSDEAIAMARRSVELDPFSTLAIDDYGRTLYFARRYDEAIAQYDRAMRLDRNDTIALWFRVYAQIAAKREDAALESIAEIVKGAGPERVTYLRELYRTGGFPAVARKWAERDIVAAQGTPFIRSTGIASRYAMAGDRDLAFEWLERAYDSHTRDLVYIRVEPGFDSVRNDPRFATLVTKVFGGRA